MEYPISSGGGDPPALRLRVEHIVGARRLSRLPSKGRSSPPNITNARAEGINSRIQWIKRTACGYRNRDRFRQSIHFDLEGLDLYPAGVKATHTT